MKTTLSNLLVVPSLLSQMEDAPILPQMPGDATAAHYITLSALVLPAYRCAELLPPGRSTL